MLKFPPFAINSHIRIVWKKMMLVDFAAMRGGRIMEHVVERTRLGEGGQASAYQRLTNSFERFWLGFP
jgi:hypothetical protein